MPHLEEVQWYASAANEASAALRRAAGELRHSAGERSRAAQAIAEWRGKYRTNFDEYLRRIVSEAEALAQGYEAAAARIDRASADARKEQALRKRMREEQERRKREQSAGR